jgi:hypothetical protein
LRIIFASCNCMRSVFEVSPCRGVLPTNCSTATTTTQPDALGNHAELPDKHETRVGGHGVGPAGGAGVALVAASATLLRIGRARARSRSRRPTGGSGSLSCSKTPATTRTWRTRAIAATRVTCRPPRPSYRGARAAQIAARSHSPASARQADDCLGDEALARSEPDRTAAHGRIRAPAVIARRWTRRSLRRFAIACSPSITSPLAVQSGRHADITVPGVQQRWRGGRRRRDPRVLRR